MTCDSLVHLDYKGPHLISIQRTQTIWRDLFVDLARTEEKRVPALNLHINNPRRGNII